MSTDDLLSLLRADSLHDAVIERVGEADYGCEDCAENAQEKVWVLLLLRSGAERSMELPAARLDALELKEGSLCVLSDLTRTGA